ncbi:bile acid:sodium symporter family protein [Leisingera sp. HS039]|uniref:bile acid:sodium symporter family protein n=1 Tax=unclassified Leisingera TaxID=2614906 RepID=UPI001070E88C|nr:MULTISPECIES: bile acid:sodium symporter family protein [unclassified Leisingera]MBQ4826317.1 bile acid:sodium symporter family protein [Leisingera sp. HS039]QBR37846.1 bile acid:sodium symporter family protein [Leisingera sp. NJS201]
MDIGAIITSIALAGLVSVMFSMGTSLSAADFLRVLRQPKALFLGITGQILLLPLAAAGIAIAMDLSPAASVGLMVIAACPGGAPSNAVCAVARGDVALSVSLTAVASVLAFLTVPFIIGLGIEFFLGESTTLHLPFWETAFRIFLTTFLPVVSGIVVGAVAPEFAVKVRRPMFIGGFVTILITSLLFVAGRMHLISAFDAFGAVVVLNVLMMGLAFVLGRMARLKEDETRAVTVEVGMQNISMSIVVIMGILNAPELLGPTFFYLPWAYVTGLGFAFLVRKLRAPALA